MEATCDLDGDVVENSDYEDAFNKLMNMMSASIASGKLPSNVVNQIANVQKVMK
jgi:hypothetical protein